MGFPKKIKKDIKLTEDKILFERRQELVDFIKEDGTYLPKSILHEDLDLGMLEFVKNELGTVVSGKKIPTIDLIITTQNWAQFAETWDFTDLDENINPPFVTTVRNPDVKFGSNPALKYNIPNKKMFYYAKVPTWDGNRKGMDIYKIPQPIPVDITYNVKIFCNRMTELNAFNKTVVSKFASRQAYTFVNGHYIPIILENISDESALDLEKRKYYVQDYSLTMLGFLIDENEFEVYPAINRILQMVEVVPPKKKRQKFVIPDLRDTDFSFTYLNGLTSLSQKFDFNADISFNDLINVESYYVYVNNEYFGQNSSVVFVNNGDTLTIDIRKLDDNEDSKILVTSKLI
jgi:hypothetical protein